MLIDTHAHFYLEEFNEDVNEAIKLAKQNGVSQILMPNVDVKSIPLMHQLESKHPDFLKSMMGLHPCYVGTEYLNDLKICEDSWQQRNYVAVGEIGIDLYWDKTKLKEQQDAFRQQIQLAKSLKKPIAIHARESFKEIFEILDEENSEDLTGVLHCFTGGQQEAQKVLSYGGFKIGIGGVVTFKNAGLDKVVKDIPLSDIILETDCPYLAPAPKRGKRNEPGYLLYIAEKIAEIKNESLKTIGEITTENAKELFKI